MSVFLCPVCGETLDGFPPSKCGSCGHAIGKRGGVHWFCEDAPISLEEDAPKYVGYEQIGEHYEPGSVFYGPQKDFEGVYDACSRRLVDLLGQGCVVVDLGAGLGTASIPLAKAGARVIAADISERMLAIAASRAKGVLPGNLVLARMNAYALPLADNSVDAVVENSMLHLVDRPGIVIDEIRRILKPEGKFVRYSTAGLERTPRAGKD